MNKISLYTLKINRYQTQALSSVLFLLWLIMLPACGVQNEPSPTNTPPVSVQGTATDQANLDNTPTATKQLVTSEPTATATTLATLPPLVTSAEAVTPDVSTTAPAITITPLPTPTLSAEEKRQRWQMIDSQVEAIMDSNNGCQLPCWWGIEAGDSVADAQQIFNTINVNGWVDSADQWGELQQVGFFDHFYRNEMGEIIYAGFMVDLLVQEDVIKVLAVNVGRSISSPPGTPEYNQISERLLRDWGQFSAQNMFKTFGEPGMIYLLPQGFADGNNLSYLFNLYYPALGIVVSYSSPLLVDNNGERTMCLNMVDMDSVDLLLYDPVVELSASYLQANYRLWPLSSELKPEDIQLVGGSDLESRTGMTIDEFVTFALENENNDICFTVN